MNSILGISGDSGHRFNTPKKRRFASRVANEPLFLCAHFYISSANLGMRSMTLALRHPYLSAAFHPQHHAPGI